MKCYQHRSNDAVGICRCCGKARCAECAVDLGFALTCPGECEQQAVNIHQLNGNARAVYSAQKRNRYLAGVFFMILGAIYLGFSLQDKNPLFGFSMLCGLSFFGFGLFLLIAQLRLMRKIKTSAGD